ncbi:hypothetical protein EYF80_034224 [Liparis tanakae]|uniref:Uncharacterized protein n=1 Tax=Liparis tanakae TaxID=230148 RepID=A0A4Z2GQ41_9TELE|nr:hypothetical protein EYF80_034224 [Liparis tanakae]
MTMLVVEVHPHESSLTLDRVELRLRFPPRHYCSIADSEVGATFIHSSVRMSSGQRELSDAGGGERKEDSGAPHRQRGSAGLHAGHSERLPDANRAGLPGMGGGGGGHTQTAPRTDAWRPASGARCRTR